MGAVTSTVRLKLEGMTCAACVSAIENGLLLAPGVVECSVSLMAKGCLLRIDPCTTDTPRLVAAVAALGYGATPADAGEATKDVHMMQRGTQLEARTLRRQLLGSLLFTLPVLVLSMVLPHTAVKPSLNKEVTKGLTVRVLVIWILTTPVQFGFGMRFYVSAYHSLRRRAANMDVLIALGTSAAYLYSVVFILVSLATAGEQGHDMEVFETSAVLISIMLFGGFLKTCNAAGISNPEHDLPAATICSSHQCKTASHCTSSHCDQMLVVKPRRRSQSFLSCSHRSRSAVCGPVVLLLRRRWLEALRRRPGALQTSRSYRHRRWRSRNCSREMSSR